MSPILRSLCLSALLVGAAGCATRPAPSPTNSADSEVPRYFRGLESEYVVRLSSLPDEESLPADSVMRDALLSGDGDVYVSAALFRSEDKLCMDLIVLNHAAESIEIGRENLKLVDNQGRFLEPVVDFEGADAHGLRSRRNRGEQNLPAVAPPEWASNNSGAVRNPTGDGKSYQAPPARRMPDSATLSDWAQLSTSAESGAPNVPEQIRVESEQGRAYWAYWEAGDSLHYPLTAFVTMGDLHMMFQFERP